MIVQTVDGLPVRLRAPHDLSWTALYGKVFCVFDELTSGMLALGIYRGGRSYYLRYAGAPTIRYAGHPGSAEAKLRQVAEAYAAISHQALAPLVASRELPGGFVCVFPWMEGTPLGPLAEDYAVFRSSPALERMRMMDSLIDLHVHLEGQGLVALGLQEAHLLVNLQAQRLLLTNIDDYARMPVQNTRSRTPGSPFYLAPECYQPGAALDETTTVFALGALTHLFFGDRAQPNRAAWQLSDSLYEVALQAMQPDRDQRQQSALQFQGAWRDAVMRTHVY